MNPLDSASENAGVRGPSTARLAVAGAALLLAAIACAWQLQSTWRLEAARSASDAATILALAGIRAFTEQANAQALMEFPLGADSMIVKARVFAGDESAGSYAVNAARVGASAFRVRSTGRLVSRGKSMMCRLDVFVQLQEDLRSRPSFGVEQDPLCNGSRHRSAVTRIRNIGS